MITELHLSKTATYDTDGIKIKDLKKINFIYGSNGSGKTTITKFIHDPAAESYGDCAITWALSPVRQLVYNKDFRDRNFSKESIDGVFTLGQATKEEIDHIDELKIKRKSMQDDGATKKKTLEGMITQQKERDEDFKEAVWTGIYKKHEDNFKEAFRGYLSKEAFKTKLLQEHANNKGRLLTLAKLQGFAQTILGERPATLSMITVPGYGQLNTIEAQKIWQKKVIGKADVDIAALIQALNMNDWVNQGRGYLQANSTCPFCQQDTITSDFRKNLDAYFDTTFTDEIEQVKNFGNQYLQLCENLLNIFYGIESIEKTNPASKLNLELFTAHVKTLASTFYSNKSLIEIKLKEPSRSVELATSTAQLEAIVQLVGAANTEITKHNKIVANFEKAKTELIDNIWCYLLEESKTLINTFIKRRDGLQQGIDSLSIRVEKLRTYFKDLNRTISDLGKNITSVQPSVDQINETLRSYGFHNFMIVPSAADSNKYQIQRENGELAEATLSEGEVTFITFLYFLQLAKGSSDENSISDERILVVDDPISSLDSSILFVVSTLLKDIIKDIKEEKGNIKQLILLTHNVYFHKEVSFINGRTKECNQTNYWILRRYNNKSTIQSFQMQNPIQNSYELLWKELKNRAHNSGLTIQNTMRRIIENYFKILGRFGDDELLNRFDSVDEREICRSLLCWINDGSHSIPDDIFIERQDEVIDKYFLVFEKIFLYTKHIEHYKMMMGAEVNAA